MEITGDAAAQYRADSLEMADLGLSKVPVTPKEFRDRWLESEGGRAITEVRSCLRFAVSPNANGGGNASFSARGPTHSRSILKIYALRFATVSIYN